VAASAINLEEANGWRWLCSGDRYTGFTIYTPESVCRFGLELSGVQEAPVVVSRGFPGRSPSNAVIAKLSCGLKVPFTPSKVALAHGLLSSRSPAPGSSRRRNHNFRRTMASVEMLHAKLDRRID
jgi:hypothetical protein